MKRLDFEKSIGLQNNILLTITLILKILVLIMLIYGLVTYNWFITFISALFLIFSITPTIAEKNFNFYLPLEFDFILVFFMFLTLILGEVNQFYVKYLWWDILLHTMSGFLIGLIGFLSIYSLRYTHKVKLSAALVILFSFSFSICVAAIWEVVEFFIDYFLGTNMQKGLMDTMTDIIVAIMGALVVSLFGFLYIKKGKNVLFERMIMKIILITKRNRRKIKNNSND